MNLIFNILYDTMYHATPILLAVMGGLFAYKAGVLNIALEGMMLTGSFVSILVALKSTNIFLAYLVSVLCCLLVGLLFSYLGVKRKGNVIIIGLAINMLIPAIAGFVLQHMGVANLTADWINPAAFKINIPIIKDIPFLGSLLSGHPIGTYISLLSVYVSYVLLYKTKFGIYTRVVGESPESAKSLGININKYRTLAILVGAVSCAVAGLNLSYERLGLFTNNMIGGRGFIAIGAIYCGNGDPLLSAFYALIFGLARSLSINLSVYTGAVSGLFDTLPYLIMVIALAINCGIQGRNNKLRTYW